MQLRDCGGEGPLPRLHADNVAPVVGLLQVAGRAGRHHVLPGGQPALGAGNHVVKGQLLAAAAILAGEAIAQEHVEAGKRRGARGLDVGLQAHDGGQAHREAGRGDGAVIFGQDRHPVHEHGLDRILPRPQRERVIGEGAIIGVEDKGGAGLGRDRSGQLRVNMNAHAKTPVGYTLSDTQRFDKGTFLFKAGANRTQPLVGIF